MERETVVVVFRKEKFNGEIVAVFPHEDYNRFLVSCYAHIGQHSGCSLDYVRKGTSPATPEEYAPLLRELKSIGYDPIIRKKCTRKSRP